MRKLPRGERMQDYPGPSRANAMARLVPYRMESAAAHRDALYPSGNWAVPDEPVAGQMLRDMVAEVCTGSPGLERRRRAGRKLMAEKLSDKALREGIAERLRSHFKDRFLSVTE